MAIIRDENKKKQTAGVGPSEKTIVSSTAPAPTTSGRATGTNVASAGSAPVGSGNKPGIGQYLAARTPEQLKRGAERVSRGLQQDYQKGANLYSKQAKDFASNIGTAKDITAGKTIDTVDHDAIKEQLAGAQNLVGARETTGRDALEESQRRIAATQTTAGKVSALEALARKQGIDARRSAGSRALSGALLSRPQESRGVFGQLREKTGQETQAVQSAAQENIDRSLAASEKSRGEAADKARAWVDSVKQSIQAEQERALAEAENREIDRVNKEIRQNAIGQLASPTLTGKFKAGNPPPFLNPEFQPQTMKEVGAEELSRLARENPALGRQLDKQYDAAEAAAMGSYVGGLDPTRDSDAQILGRINAYNRLAGNLGEDTIQTPAEFREADLSQIKPLITLPPGHTPPEGTSRRSVAPDSPEEGRPIPEAFGKVFSGDSDLDKFGRKVGTEGDRIYVKPTEDVLKTTAEAPGEIIRSVTGKGKEGTSGYAQQIRAIEEKPAYERTKKDKEVLRQHKDRIDRAEEKRKKEEKTSSEERKKQRISRERDDGFNASGTTVASDDERFKYYD